MKKLNFLLMAVLAVCLASCLGDNDDNGTPIPDIVYETVNFEKASLPTTGDHPGVMIGQSYESENGYVFQNYYDGSIDYNAGFTVSNNNDTKTAGPANQYSVFSSSNNKNNQFLIYNPPYGATSYIQRKDGKAFYPNSVYVAPTTYTMLSIFNGDDYAKKFEEKDTFAVKFQGCDAEGNIIKNSQLTFKLVDKLALFQYDSYYGYGYQKFVYVNGTDNLWTPIPLYLLGKVNKILISFDSSDKGVDGINTPLYLALDEFNTVAPQSEADYQNYLDQQSKK